MAANVPQTAATAQIPHNYACRNCPSIIPEIPPIEEMTEEQMRKLVSDCLDAIETKERLTVTAGDAGLAIDALVVLGATCR